MINNKIKNFILFLFILTFSMCDPVDDKLVIRNESSQKIYFLKNEYDKLSKLYEEVLKKQGVELTYLNCIEIIEPNSENRQLLTGARKNAWEKYINNVCEDGKLRIYTFNIDTLKKYNFKEIANSNRYVQKREFSVKELQELNWQIKL